MNAIIDKIKGISLLAVFFCCLAACEKELDVAPVMTYDGEATTTIAALKALHTIGSSDSSIPITDSIVISGTIISSDEHGNCYKYITIQDETGGIQIKIDNSSLYPKYQVGQRVFVECAGLDLGDYRKNPQMGWWVDGSMSGISSSKEDLYVHRDGLVAAEPAPIVLTSARDLREEYINCLVKLENCSFENAGRNPYSSPSSSTSENIKFSDGTALVLRTSNYATFASEILPEGNGTIYGILTVYNTTYQITIRSLDDVKMQSEETVHAFDFSNDPFANGWQSINVAGGADWTYRNFQGQRFVSIEDLGAETDSWLVSPAISNLANYSDISLSFDHRVMSDANVSGMKLYYSTTYTGGAIDESQWTELPIAAFPTARSTAYMPLDPAVVAHPNFRIAYRYAGSDNGWTLFSIKFNAIISK